MIWPLADPLTSVSCFSHAGIPADHSYLRAFALGVPLPLESLNLIPSFYSDIYSNINILETFSVVISTVVLFYPTSLSFYPELLFFVAFTERYYVSPQLPPPRIYTPGRQGLY